MQTQPPFDPPYVSTYSAEDGIRHVETLADGSTRILSTAEYAERYRVITALANAEARGSALAKTTSNATGKSASSSSATNKAAVILNVPFAEKDQAKGLGARWDAARKKWYVPHGVDANLFSRWLPDELK
ncbi:DUF5710 domain-containing protein [Herbaspirillum sp. GCM10030257]|uniref:DUF5710 domain-containing protein n=1 Tax=Herbaspirillum sp. GCM10030257 TaxID=3273393 RepID=UPI00360F5F68